MRNVTALESEVAQLIVENLNLEDVSPSDIDPHQPLFGDGLGLDSIDALELALVISKTYGMQLRSDDPDNRKIFGSLHSLCQYIETHRKK